MDTPWDFALEFLSVQIVRFPSSGAQDDAEAWFKLNRHAEISFENQAAHGITMLEWQNHCSNFYRDGMGKMWKVQILIPRAALERDNLRKPHTQTQLQH